MFKKDSLSSKPEDPTSLNIIEKIKYLAGSKKSLEETNPLNQISFPTRIKIAFHPRPTTLSIGKLTVLENNSEAIQNIHDIRLREAVISAPQSVANRICYSSEFETPLYKARAIFSSRPLEWTNKQFWKGASSALAGTAVSMGLTQAAISLYQSSKFISSLIPVDWYATGASMTFFYGTFFTVKSFLDKKTKQNNADQADFNNKPEAKIANFAKNFLPLVLCEASWITFYKSGFSIGSFFGLSPHESALSTHIAGTILFDLELIPHIFLPAGEKVCNWMTETENGKNAVAKIQKFFKILPNSFKFPHS